MGETVARRGMRLWEPFGFAHGLTLGKALVDVVVRDSTTTSGEERKCCRSQRTFLISVDEAEEIVSHVIFRQRYGPDAPLPESLLAGRPANKVQWILLDLFDMF